MRPSGKYHGHVLHLGTELKILTNYETQFLKHLIADTQKLMTRPNNRIGRT
jgi:hypothetical protein